jgi:hypothetical protein
MRIMHQAESKPCAARGIKTAPRCARNQSHALRAESKPALRAESNRAALCAESKPALRAESKPRRAARGIKTARCARSKSLALRAESNFSPRCARNQK